MSKKQKQAQKLLSNISGLSPEILRYLSDDGACYLAQATLSYYSEKYGEDDDRYKGIVKRLEAIPCPWDGMNIAGEDC